VVWPCRAQFVFFGKFVGMRAFSPVHKSVDNVWTNFQMGGRIAEGFQLRSGLLGE